MRDVDFTLDRHQPAADLAGLVERHWLVSWALPPGRSASVTLLPHPCVNLALDDRLGVYGVGPSGSATATAGSAGCTG